MINKGILTVIILVMMAVNISRAYSQVPDSTRIKKISYLKSLLMTDTATARKAMDIQDLYKQALKQVLGNEKLLEPQKRAVIDSLMNEKNRKLEELLPEEQRNLLIPTTERRRTWKRDTTARKN